MVDRVIRFRGKDGIIREVRRKYIEPKIIVRDDSTQGFDLAEWSMDMMGFDVGNLFPSQIFDTTGLFTEPNQQLGERRKKKRR